MLTDVVLYCCCTYCRTSTNAIGSTRVFLVLCSWRCVVDVVDVVAVICAPMIDDDG